MCRPHSKAHSHAWSQRHPQLHVAAGPRGTVPRGGGAEHRPLCLMMITVTVVTTAERSPVRGDLPALRCQFSHSVTFSAKQLLLMASFLHGGPSKVARASQPVNLRATPLSNQSRVLNKG